MREAVLAMTIRAGPRTWVDQRAAVASDAVLVESMIVAMTPVATEPAPRLLDPPLRQAGAETLPAHVVTDLEVLEMGARHDPSHRS